MLNIVSAIFVLGILIFVHELGHFLFCKIFGVGVEKFSLGFGRKLVGWRRGETEYMISAFPLGGYVKMFGEGAEEDELSEEDRTRTFMGKGPLVRIAIVAAGPSFNLLFAYLIFVVVLISGYPLDSSRVGKVVPGKPAAAAGVLPGDVVLSVDGKKVSFWDQMAMEIVEGKEKVVRLGVRRGGQELTLTVTPEVMTDKNLFGETISRRAIGIVRSDEKIIRRTGFGEAFVQGFTHTVDLIRVTFVMLWKLFERTVPLDSIGGPIMIVAEAGKQAAAGSSYFLFFMAALSVNLGILNFLPIPILDGGHLLFYVIELVTRRPVSVKVREAAQQIGLVLLVSLMLLAFYNDIIRYFVKVLQ